MGYYGPYRALVVNNSDPESLNRIQVQIPQIMGSATSGWAYPIPVDVWGAPAVGSQVMVTFEGGDLCHPLYFADSTGVSQAYIDNGDSTTLASSKTYADSGDATTLASAKSYADSGDSTTLASAKSYADSGDATVQGNLNTHVAATTSVHGIADTSKLVATGTGKNKLTGWFHADAYGADPTGASDSGPAINSAINDAKVAGGVVYLPPGTYKIGTTINLSDIHPLAYHYNQDPGVTLRGAGRHATILTGGETAYGIMELVGSNRITVEHMSLQPTGTVQYGILTGRTTGDGSSGEHVFNDVTIYGGFTLAALFAMSSEMCSYNRMLVYTTTGKGVVLARENDATYNAVAKYTPLSTSTTIAGGNGQNRLSEVSILTISTSAGDYPLTLEYVQTFTADNLYVYSQTGPTAQIFMKKLCFGAVFNGLQQEYSGTRPLGFYISAAGASPSSPDYRGICLRGGRALSVYGEDNARLAEFEFVGTEWRGADTWQLDVHQLYDSIVKYDTRTTSTSTRVTNPQYRVRYASAGNTWGPTDVSNLGTPAVTLGTTASSGGTFAAGTYYWVVSATNSYGESIASNEVTAAVAANGTQTINWTATVGATGYKVFRSTTSGNYSGSTRVALLGNVLTYTDTGTAPAAAAPLTVATAGWPSAAYRGKGAVLWDVTGGTPIWSDGTTWQVLKPYTDTGWVNLTLNAGYTAGSPAPQVRQQNNKVSFRGVIQSSTNWSGSVAAASIPSSIGACPVQRVFVGYGTPSASSIRITLDLDTNNAYRTLTISAPVSGSTNYVELNGEYYTD